MGLVLPMPVPRQGCGSHSVPAHRQPLVRIGGHQPGSAAASGAARAPVISGCSAQVGGELFPFPGVHFRAVRPETDDCGVFLVRSEGTPGVLHVMVQKAIPLWQAGPGRQLWSETLGCDTLGFPISP